MIFDAWQGVLGADHAAIFGYRRLGPRLEGETLQALARSFEAAHRTSRDALITALIAAGQAPVLPLADYPVAQPLATSADAEQAALELELTCAAAARYLLLVAASVPLSDANLLPTSLSASPTTARLSWRRLIWRRFGSAR